ncbi:MAG: hypothetical protein RL318_1726 [Fibrobacterota bacterium]|jgi:hypothetical protein
MRMENLPPLFFQAKRWWLWPMLTLPDSVQAKLALWKINSITGPSVERPSCDLWQGKGTLLLYTSNPDAFLLRPSLEGLLHRFPGISLVVHELQAAWWQTFLPTAKVIGLPELDLWDSSHQDWLVRNLQELRGDWCWNLRPDDHPLSLALTRILGASWRIGHGGQPWSNLSIESSAGSHPWQGTPIETLRKTFGWDAVSVVRPTPSGETALHIPSLPLKKLPAWGELTRELVKRQKALVFQSGRLGGIEGIQTKDLPSAQTLHQLSQRLGLWVGPWDTHAGALASCGVPVLAIGGKRPHTPLRHTSKLPKPGQYQAWWDASKKAPPQRDEA